MFDFANIDLIGPCHYKCFYCLGNLTQINGNYLKSHFDCWQGFEGFLYKLQENNVKQIYLTGHNTDPLQYKHLDPLVDYLQAGGFRVGLRTNGLLARIRMSTINKLDTCMGDAVGYSMLSLNADTTLKIAGREDVPVWSDILSETKVPYRCSIVINRYNASEIGEMLEFLSQFSPEYVQLRKVYSDDRHARKLKADRDAFENIRQHYESNAWAIEFFANNIVIKEMYPFPLDLWRMEDCTMDTLTYFVNGTSTEFYFVGKTLETED
jgi:molybdenum cofactor biosynthesis enzyme MoaA